MRVVQTCSKSDLSKETLGAKAGGELRSEHLERHQAVVLEIAREVDRGHPAPTELALDVVAVT